MFTEEFRGAGPKQNSSLLEWGVRGPGAEVISTKSAGKAEDGRVREGNWVGSFTHNLVGKAGRAIALVVGGVSVVTAEKYTRYTVVC